MRFSWSIVILVAGCTDPAAPPARVDVHDFGARGDGATDDTAAIQAALDAPGVTTVAIPDGVYRIDAGRGLRPHSQQTLELASGATLQVIPNALPTYDLLGIFDTDGVTLRGGTLAGDRFAHVLPDGYEDGHGHGVTILGSTHVIVDGVTARDFWGDGFYIGPSDTQHSSAIELTNNVALANRRQGLSITDAVNVVITNNQFLETNGTAPEAGIDLEPSSAGDVVRDIQIVDNTFVGNTHGLSVIQLEGITDNVLISNNSIQNNHLYGLYLAGVPSTVLVHRNVIRGNTIGLELVNAEDSRIEDNLIELNPHGGISLSSTNRIAISGNRMYSNGDATGSYDNIDVADGSFGNTIERNVIRAGIRPSAARYGIHIESADCTGNAVLANDLACAGADGALVDAGTGTLVLDNSATAICLTTAEAQLAR